VIEAISVTRAQRSQSTKSFGERLEDLYSAHGAHAVRLAFLLTGDQNEAEDICQEAFARVGGRLGALRDPERASGYLFRTVVNLSRSHGRRLRKDRRLFERLPTDASVPPPDVSVRDAMARELMRLPLRQRTALFCRYYADLTEAQTSEVLNCSAAAARSLVFRALENVRRHMKEEVR
jgi:RNA polymerase sigma factor (sigma-70 family)